MKNWSIVIPISVLAVAMVLLFAIRGHWNSWKSDAILQKTNDAYVAADQISKAAIAASRAALASSLQQRSALNAKNSGLIAQIAAKTAGLTATKVNLNYAKIFAPADGRVGRLQVHPGQLLGAGVQIINFVQDGSWVEANFLETQLAQVRIGDAVDIKIDAYPSQIFHGHVGKIAPASGSASALLPPDNATGNFTKVIQRVPIKILVDGDSSQELLRPGLSAEVAIHTDRIEAPKANRPDAN